ncbi:MAG: hypothetical protein U0Y82_16815 [Thermoleophilia bacterium]
MTGHLVAALADPGLEELLVAAGRDADDPTNFAQALALAEDALREARIRLGRGDS